MVDIYSTVEHIENACAVIAKGGVIIYPTESMYGLGCDPFNHAAVKKLLTIKKREENQGLILIAWDIEQLMTLIHHDYYNLLDNFIDGWPKNETWIFPKSSIVPKWISGANDSVAIRIPDHLVAKSICKEYGRPIVSTSANVSGMPPCITISEVESGFSKDSIDYFVPLPVGAYQRPSTIKDALTGITIR